MIARIMLRNELGNDPTTSEINNRVKDLKKKFIAPPPLDVITTAFMEGEEVRPVLFLCPQATH